MESAIKTRVVRTTEFKAKCSAYLDELETDGGSITITRRGRAVAVLTPSKKRAFKSLKGSWAGRMTIVGDIVYYHPLEGLAS